MIFFYESSDGDVAYVNDSSDTYIVTEDGNTYAAKSLTEAEVNG